MKDRHHIHIETKNRLHAHVAEKRKRRTDTHTSPREGNEVQARGVFAFVDVPSVFENGNGDVRVGKIPTL
jgi:hypothetical protein